MSRKRKQLIPFEKRRRVIRLDRRGRADKGFSIGTALFGGLGILCILYCIAIAFAGFGTYFFLIWSVLGIALLGLGVLFHKRFSGCVPKWLKSVILALICPCIIAFCVVEGIILSQYHATAAPGADYCIILGAQWKSNGPSEVLRRRLDRALVYLQESPNTMVIVSGGQGSNEVISEAEGMKQYLMEAGIPEERILVEAKSTNTYENLAFSSALMDKGNSRVVIVTNNFHMFRALKLAKRQGYHADGLAADSVAWMVPNNLLREFIGVLKDFAVGNM